MPKAKPTQIVVHRIELQETERAALEAALAGNFVTNAVNAAGSVLSGFGQALAPFSGALTAIAGLWIADKTVEEVMEKVKDKGEQVKQEREESYHEKGNLNMQRFNAWLIATYETGGWDAICNPLIVSEWLRDVMNPLSPAFMPPWFVTICTDFLNTICAQSEGMKANQIPSELWQDYYSIEQYGSDAYYHATGGTAWGALTY